MSVGTCIFLCILSFIIGEISAIILIALLSANKEYKNNDNK